MDALIRRVEVTIEYLNKDISNIINGYISKIETIDNYEGIIDSLKIEFLNKDNMFLKSEWAFKVGEKIKIGCKTLNWENQKDGEKRYFFGEYYVDERILEKEYFILKGLSIPLSAKDSINTKSWEEITLTGLAKEFATKYNLELLTLISTDITFRDLSQEKVTDFSFLKKIAEDENINIKIAKDKLILFEDTEMERKEQVIALDLNRVIDYSFKETSNTIYDSIEIMHLDTLELKEQKEIITIEELRGEKIPGLGMKPLRITSDYNNKSKNFKEFALKKLKFANKKAKVISIRIIGKPGIYAGQTIEIVNSGILNGIYLMTIVKQSIPNFVTTLQGYKL